MTALASSELRSPVDIVRDLFANLLNRRDAGLLTPYWAEDVVEEFPTGKVVGREALKQYFADLFAAIPDFHIEAKTIVGEGERVFVRWHVTGTFSGRRWLGIEPTGSAIRLDGVDCFTIRNNVIVHNFVAYDQLSFARQIGLLPEQGSVLDRAMLGTFNMKTKLLGASRTRN
jgi:predicted ester cyclase